MALQGCIENQLGGEDLPNKPVIRSIKFNALMNTMLTASNMIVGVVTLPYITRVLSVRGYGDVSFAQSVSTWLSALCLVGINVYGVRECAKVRDDQNKLSALVKELLIIITATSLAVLTVFALSIQIVPQFKAIAQLMWMFLFGTLILSYGVEWFYQAIEQYAYITKRSIIFKLLSLVLTLLLVRKPQDYLIYGGILAFVMCGNNLINLFMLRKYVDFKVKRKLNLRRHFRPLISFGLQSISSAVYLSFDSTLLGFITSSNYQVGLYQLATKLKGVMFQVLNAVLGVFIPRLSCYLGQGDMPLFLSLVRRASGLTINICISIFFYLYAFAPGLVLLISGPSFDGAVLPVRIIGLVNLCSCYSYFIGLCVLTPLGRERQLALANFAGVPVSVLLNFLLDARFGAVGASLSILLAEALILSLQLYWARDVVSKVAPIIDVLRICLSNIMAASIAYLISSMVLPVQSSLFAIVGLILFVPADLFITYVFGDPTARMIFDGVTSRFHKDGDRLKFQ
ncbi:MAG: oligosaccharide flippase family protein [Collinsella intestinalis]|uniref:Oligosaccharide flippase family protein n=1 Tax=Collinsella intestinalis TaxID=147207 RepID=A0A943BL95_9ACTN|nr:oligosaccharide flippase family protein [Collinsella intestinalis]